MLVIGKVGRAAAVLCAVAGLAACSSSDDAPDPAPNGSLIDATTMRGALLQPADIGPTWKVPATASPPPNPLVSVCGGEASPPPVPGSPTVLSAPLVDEGAQGAQTLHQTALVYGDPAAAATGLAALRAAADGCPPTVSVPENAGGARQEPAYTETVTTTALDEAGWTGFVVVRHKAYDPKHPATADTAVAVLAKRNVVLVDAYAIYRLGAPASTGAQFTSDWQRLVGTVVSRIGA